jgi:hypothetical protein
MLRAAALVARAEAASLDPNMDVGELTKLVNSADRAVRRLGVRVETLAPQRALQRARRRWDEAEQATQPARRRRAPAQTTTEAPDDAQAED